MSDRKSRSARRVAIASCATTLIGCAHGLGKFQEETIIEGDDASVVDAADAAPRDASEDRREGSVADAPHDATNDVGRDVVLDAASDAPADVSRDAASDARVEASVDASLDAGDPATAGEITIDVGAATTASTAVTLYLVPPRNLVANGGFESGTAGWTLVSAGDGWSARGGLFGAHAEIGSYSRETLEATVDLVASGVSTATLDSGAAIDVGVFATSTGCAGCSVSGPEDTRALRLSLRDAAGAEIASWDSGDAKGPLDDWQNVAHEMTLPVGTRSAVVTIAEQDGEFWAGFYGAAFDGASLVVGGLPEMRVSNDGVVFDAWAPFTARRSWTLEPGSGRRVVWVEFRDAVTHQSLGMIGDEIELVAPVDASVD